MKSQTTYIIPAPACTYLVIAQNPDLASFDPILAYRLSSTGTAGSGPRIAMLASGEEVDLAEDFDRISEFGVMDASGNISSGGQLFSDIESFCQTVLSLRIN